MSNKTLFHALFFVIFLQIIPQSPIFAQETSEKKQTMLVFFSEDGIRFWVSINGEKQNNVASANVKIPVTQQTWAKAKIIFENESLPEISKNVMMDTNGDVTYRIKKVRKKYVVRLYSATGGDLEENEIKISQNNEPCIYATSSETLYNTLGAIRDETFEANKLSMGKRLVDNNCLLVEHIKSIMKSFEYEASRLEFAKYAYKRVVDRQNYYLLNDNFEYENSKSALNDFVNKNK